LSLIAGKEGVSCRNRRLFENLTFFIQGFLSKSDAVNNRGYPDLKNEFGKNGALK